MSDADGKIVSRSVPSCALACGTPRHGTLVAGPPNPSPPVRISLIWERPASSAQWRRTMEGPSQADLDKLIATSNEALQKLKGAKIEQSVETVIEQDIASHTAAIKRIEEMQRSKAQAGWAARLQRYLNRDGAGLFWVVTTGLLCGMAWTRLQEKYEMEVRVVKREMGCWWG